MASTSNLNKSLPQASAPGSPIQRRNPWTPQTEHAYHDANDDINNHVTVPPPLPHPPPSPPVSRPSDTTFRAGISLRAFLLGAAFGISFPLIVLSLVSYDSPFWRLPFFLLTLSLFHFLEYYITARFNPAAASISAFLLSQNGSAYNVAHTLALFECALHCYFWPPHGERGLLQSLHHSGNLVLGLALIIIGQTTRTMAMAHAGTNFNHLVQSRRKQGHVLVTSGIYSWLRHPSYFGFWWWGLGTQLVLGNMLCFVGYAVVLWRFFRSRIEGTSASFGCAFDV